MPPSMPNVPEYEVAVFNAALLLVPGQRAAYLDQACSGNPALRARIEALLQVHGEVGTFLETTIPETKSGSGSTLRPPLAAIEKTGDHIGRYKLLQQIGEGG